MILTKFGLINAEFSQKSFVLMQFKHKKTHGGCLKIASADTELVFLKNLPIFVVYFRGLVFVYGETLANLYYFIT